jgi:hypothetical protein
MPNYESSPEYRANKLRFARELEDGHGNTVTDLSTLGGGGVQNPMQADLDAAGNDITNVGSLDTDEQNNNEINLTRLVEDGTYNDIVHAMVTEPSNHSVPKRYLIESGTYQVSTQYTLSKNDVEFVAYGTGQNWIQPVADGGNFPVVLEWTGTTGGGETMLTLGDGANQLEGVRFRGIEFRPETEDAAVTAIHGAGSGTSNVTQDITFERCAFRRFDTPFSYASRQQNFDWKFMDCGWDIRVNAAVLGGQATVFNGYVFADGTTGLDLYEKSQLWGLKADVSNGATGIAARALCDVRPANLEGDQSAGLVGIEVNHTGGRTQIGGNITSMETAVEVTSGPIMFHATTANITGDVINLAGGNNAHNGSVILGVAPTNIAVNSYLQNMAVLGPPADNLAAADVPPGYIGIDTDRGGTGTDSLVLGQTNSTSAGPWYIDTTGTL